MKKITIENFEEVLKMATERARAAETARPHSVIHVGGTLYMAAVNGTIWDISRIDEIEGDCKWIVRCPTSGDYLDPLPTLRSCREAIATLRRQS